MPKLTDQQKQIIVHLAASSYNENHTYFFKQSTESKELQTVLNASDKTLEFKWSKIEAYLTADSSQGKKLGNILRAAINDAENPRIDLAPISIANYDEEKLNYLRDKSRHSILKTVSETNDFCYSSFELKHKVTAGRLSLDEKWSLLLNFLRNRFNQETATYKALAGLLTSHNLDDDHLGYAYGKIILARVCAENNPERKALYAEALTYLLKMTNYSYDINGVIAECELNLEQYESSYARSCQAIAYIHEVRERSGAYRSYCSTQLPTLELNRNAALTRMLQEKKVSRQMTEAQQSGSIGTNFRVITRPLAEGAVMGSKPGLVFMYAGAIVPSLASLILIPFGACLSLAGAITGAVSGGLYGWFKANNREVLDIPAQVEMIEKLERVSKESDAAKAALMQKIVTEYDSVKTSAASKHSTDLLATLKSSQHSVEFKWNTLAYYMLEPEGSIFKNNGKKLFTVINENISHYLAQIDNRHAAPPVVPAAAASSPQSEPQPSLSFGK